MAVLSVGQPFVFSQSVGDTITKENVKRVISWLSSDSLKGRGNGRPELLQAAKFIGNEFERSKLQPLSEFANYYLPFRPFGGGKNSVPDYLSWNNEKLPNSQFIYVNVSPGSYAPKKLTDFIVVKLDSFFTSGVLEKIDNDTSSLLIWTDHKQPDGVNFFPLKMSIKEGGLKRNLLLVYAETAPVALQLTSNIAYYNTTQYNVVGMLKGKTKADEFILFSSHYDHEGVYNDSRDSIMNGANDNASGVTAMLMLAHYYALRNDNERTLLFCAFSGEELGLKGSYEFANYINPDKIIAGINIEMIGVRQFWKKEVFITGFRYSGLPALLEKGLRRAGIRKMSEPNEEKQLFRRSDNYPFAEKGVPAHTIMASDDDDPCYHQPCDELRRIDIPNMTAIIQGIAVAAIPLVNGTATPGRPNPRDYEREKPSNFRVKW